jgi:hypothetical protein
VLDLNPDVVIVALAMNEPHMAGADDKHASTSEASISLAQTLSGLLSKRVLQTSALLGPAVNMEAQAR